MRGRSDGLTGNVASLRESPLRHAQDILWRWFRAHEYERTVGRTSWTGDRSFVDHGDSTSARTTIGCYKYLVLVALPSASCRLAVGTHHPQRAFCCAWRPGRSLCALRPRRSRRTFRALRPRRSRWASRSCRTGFALLTRRPGRAGLPLWPLSAARYANGKRNRNRDTFHMHAHTFQTLTIPLMARTAQPRLRAVHRHILFCPRHHEDRADASLRPGRAP